MAPKVARTRFIKQSMNDMKYVKLENGLRVILAPQKESLATTVAVLVSAGSKYETKETSGLSHFLEHMCFKGTVRRPKPIDISGELDGIGAEYNAFTNQEYTSYFAKVKNDAFDEILDLVSDLYLNPTFDAKEIETERGVIIEEINMYEDLPTRKVHELFMELVYGDQPAGWSIAGTKENIKKLNREDFVVYRGRHYLPESTIVVVAGGFDEGSIVEKVEKSFSSLSAGVKEQKVKVREVQESPEELVYFKESDQTHLVLGVRAFDIFDKRRYALQVLSDILGGGMSSRLFQKVRGELGAAYYVYSSPDLYSDHGLLAVSAGIDHLKVEEVIKSILGLCSDLKDRRVESRELKKAKSHIVGKFLLSLETSDELAYFYGTQEVIGMKMSSPDQFVKRIQNVSADDVQNVARDVFKNSRLNLALIGSVRGRSFKHILGF